MSDQGPKTILLVEDEALIALAEKRQLEREGYRVLWAASGRAAIELIRDAGRGADLILMDIDLGSGMDGTLAAEEILKDHEIPVIFISSHIEKDIVERTEKITSYGYVVKNSSPTVLSTSIKMAFRLFGARREAKSRTQDLAQVLGGISDAFFTMDEDLVVTYFNPAAERMLQRPAGEVVGKYLFDTFPEARGTVSDEKYHEAVRERQFLAFETWFEPYRNWYDVRVYPMPGGIAVYFQITTERKLLEKRLAESELRFRELFDKIDTGGGHLPGRRCWSRFRVRRFQQERRGTGRSEQAGASRPTPA